MPKRIAVFILVLFAAAGLLAGCEKKEYPNPTKEFYVNDFAGALLPGSRASFLSEGERLYDSTKDTDLGGAQIVVATMLVESEDKVDEIDRTNLFRQWRIGENDMGLLILLLFTENETEEGVLDLVSAQIEIGYRMEQFVTATRAAYVLDNCLYNPEWEGSLDMGLGEMYYELLTTIYVDAYGYDSFGYDMEVYREYLINAVDESNAQLPMSYIVYLFSPYAPVTGKIIFGIVIGFSLLGGLGGGIFGRRNRGGGGRSGGYGIRR